MESVRFVPCTPEELSDGKLQWSVKDLKDASWAPKTDTGRRQRFGGKEAATVFADQCNRSNGCATSQIPGRVDRLVQAMKSGQRLVKTNLQSDHPDKSAAFHLEPSGKHVEPSAGDYAISAGIVTPIKDGLFEECSQTFEYREVIKGRC